MSKIVEKSFDPDKRIIRDIFRGSPNLFTTADLNRQIEAIKYQMDRTDDKTGVLSDATILADLSGSTLTVALSSHTYMEVKGCSFEPELPLGFLSTNMTSSAPVAYLVLTGNTETVTYDDDFSHEVAGAKFEDGSSLPSSDILRYSSQYQLVLVHSLKDIGTKIIAILAKIELTTNNNLIVSSNLISKEESLLMLNKSTIKDLDTDTSGDIENGMSYDLAFSKLFCNQKNLMSFGVHETGTFSDNDFGVFFGVGSAIKDSINYSVQVQSFLSATVRNGTLPFFYCIYNNAGMKESGITLGSVQSSGSDIKISNIVIPGYTTNFSGLCVVTFYRK